MVRIPALAAFGIFVLSACSGVSGQPPVTKPPKPELSQPQPAANAQALRVEVAAPDVNKAPPSATAASTPFAPTWTVIYRRYLGPNTQGGCNRRACHAETMRDAPSAYEWLARRGYIAGTESALVSTNNSCLRWFGGNMPPRAGANAAAARDLKTWVAAGAPNN